MEQRNYLMELRFGGLDCQISAITPEYEPTPTRSYNFHYHTGFELQAILCGSMCIHAGHRDLEFGAGQGILITPGCYHAVRSVSEDLKLMCISFEISRPETIQRKHARALAQVFYEHNEAVISIENTKVVLHFISDLVQNQPSTFWNMERLKSMMTLLILDIYDELGMPLSPSQPLVQASSRLTPIIDSFFSTHYHLNDGKELLAQQLHITPRQLNRILQKHYHMSYQEKLLETRLINALDFLTTTDMPIAEIAEKVGYDSPSNFTAFIKRATGESPREIRKKRHAGKGLAEKEKQP